MIVEAVLFDLDGTLADTAPDLVRVLNRLLRRARSHSDALCNRAQRGLERCGRACCGSGSATSARRKRSSRCAADFLDLYAEDVSSRSRLFIELDDIDHHCHELVWGVVTNKPDAFTQTPARSARARVAHGLRRERRPAAAAQARPGAAQARSRGARRACGALRIRRRRAARHRGRQERTAWRRLRPPTATFVRARILIHGAPTP